MCIITGLTCLLLLCSATNAQYISIDSNTPPQNLTVTTQAENNFNTKMNSMPFFPCDNSSSASTHTYSGVDVYNVTNIPGLFSITNQVFAYFYYSTQNLTGCTTADVQFSNLSTACGQVETNLNPEVNIGVAYGLELTVVYQCTENEAGLLTSFLTPLRATAYKPLLSGLFEVDGGLIMEDIWFYKNPMVVSKTQAPSPITSQVAPTPEELPVPAASPEFVVHSASGTSVDLLVSSVGGSNATALDLFMPAVSAQGLSTYAGAPQLLPTAPQSHPVVGFTVAQQRRSLPE